VDDDIELSQPTQQQQQQLTFADPQHELTFAGPPVARRARQLLATVTRDIATLTPVSIRILRLQLALNLHRFVSSFISRNLHTT
jgi:hypothetical protein